MESLQKSHTSQQAASKQALRYVFRCLDLHGEGYLDLDTARPFVAAVIQRLTEAGVQGPYETLNAEHVTLEIFDMLKWVPARAAARGPSSSSTAKHRRRVAGPRSAKGEAGGLVVDVGDLDLSQMHQLL